MSCSQKTAPLQPHSTLWNRIFLVLEVVTMDSDWEVVAGDEEDILCALPLLESK